VKQEILETAIVIRDWALILDYWPQVTISETMFPAHLKYFTVSVSDDLRVLVYVIDALAKGEYAVPDRIIPFLPFSLLFISQLDGEHERLWREYEQRYQTPLFFLAPDDQDLKDRIVMRENLASKLSDVIFFNAEDSLLLTWKLIVKQCLENLELQNSKAKEKVAAEESQEQDNPQGGTSGTQDPVNQ